MQSLEPLSFSSLCHVTPSRVGLQQEAAQRDHATAKMPHATKHSPTGVDLLRARMGEFPRQRASKQGEITSITRPEDLSSATSQAIAVLPIAPADNPESKKQTPQHFRRRALKKRCGDKNCTDPNCE